MAGRKEQIDWEAIERDYRVGQLSVREIARRYAIEASTITRKAKKESWVRDYSLEVKERTRAGLIEIAKQQAQHDATESNAVLRDGIEIAVETNLRVLREHQSGIRDNAKRLERLTVKFDSLVDSVANLNEFSRATSSYESLIRSQKTLISLEREALNIDTKDEPPESGLADLIAAVNGTSLPITK